MTTSDGRHAVRGLCALGAFWVAATACGCAAWLGNLWVAAACGAACWAAARVFATAVRGEARGE